MHWIHIWPFDSLFAITMRFSVSFFSFLFIYNLNIGRNISWNVLLASHIRSLRLVGRFFLSIDLYLWISQPILWISMFSQRQSKLTDFRDSRHFHLFRTKCVRCISLRSVCFSSSFRKKSTFFLLGIQLHKFLCCFDYYFI